MEKKNIVIIPAAGRGQRMMGLTENNPKAMLPYKGKPIIAHNLDMIIKNNVDEVIITVGYQKEKIIDYVLKFYKDNIKITFVEQVHLNGLAGAVHCATSTIKEDSNVMIVLGDIILQSDDFFTNNVFADALYYNPKDDFRRWCLVDINEDDKVIFYDKPKEKPITDKALIGVYKFSSSNLLNEALDSYLLTDDTVNNEYQISKAIELYNEEKKIFLQYAPAKAYIDMGEVEDLIEARKNITRHFNNIKKTHYGTIIKTSNDTNKMRNEFNWYKFLPQKLSMFTPHLFSSHDNGYEIEFLNSTPIQELFIYDLMELNDWNKLFEKINFYLDLSKDGMYTPDDETEPTEEFYVKKNVERINTLLNSELNKKYKLSEQEYITINNIAYKNPLYSDNLQAITISLYNIAETFDTKYRSYYHGDLFFGNMFYDITSESLKVIDPRGSYGSSIFTGFGDIRYDIAKLNHSIFGYYDFIVNELYTLDITEDSINYSLYEGKQKNVQKIFEEKVLSDYNREEIDFLTGILFLTMIPLHAENENNQLVQFATAVKFLNKFL